MHLPELVGRDAPVRLEDGDCRQPEEDPDHPDLPKARPLRPARDHRYTAPSRAPSPRFGAMSYAIISLGGKQYRVQEGERLLVDRVPTEEGKTFHPEVLMIGGDGNVDLAPKVQVTAKVVGSQLGDKI